MSTSYASYLFVGVRVSDIYKQEQVEKVFTRYGYYDGKPYEVTEIHTKCFLFDKEFTPTEQHPETWPELEGLDIICTGIPAYTDWNYDEFFVGSIVAECDNDENNSEVERDQINGTLFEVGERLKQRGCAVNPKVFLVHYVSY